MTPLLKNLLHSYGLLYVTVTTLQKERPGNPHASLDDYYSSLGNAEPGEPVLVVRISDDGETRFLRQSPESLPPNMRSQYSEGDVTIMELPEDEFYFFQAFRPGLFDLEKQLPSFILQIALVHAYTLFETYIADVIRIRLQAHPAQVGLKKQISVADLLGNDSKASLIAMVVDDELQQVMHMPIIGVLDALRNRFGLRNLGTENDAALATLSLTRNCLIHNAGKVDSRLAAVDSSLVVGQSIEVVVDSVTDAINTCRKYCALVDSMVESLSA